MNRLRPRGNKSSANFPDSSPGVTVSSEDDDDIVRARELARSGAQTARTTLTTRSRAIVLIIVGVFTVATLINLVANFVLYDKAVSVSVAQASQQRLNGVAQMQAMEAIEAARPYNERLAAAGLPALPIPGQYDAPAADVINAAAATVVLGTMNPDDIKRMNFSVVGFAVDRAFDERLFATSQSGPTRFRVSVLVAQYMELAPVGGVPSLTAPSPPPGDMGPVGGLIPRRIPPPGPPPPGPPPSEVNGG